ncbi:MAG: ankyrin repeat domain-containing protein [Candidatus Thiodiazotropha sp.]
MSIYYPLMQCKNLIVLMFSLWLVLGCTKPNPPTINIHRAVKIGDLDQLERNLYWDAEVNEPGPNGLTPLHTAAQKGSLVMSRILVTHGADLGALDPQGHTPLIKALVARNTRLADYLVKQGARLDANAVLHETARLGSADRDVIDFLIKQGASINHQNNLGDTPLHTAVRHDQRVVVKYLVNRGAALDLANQAGRTPLGLAIDLQHNDIARLLRQFGAPEQP